MNNIQKAHDLNEQVIQLLQDNKYSNMLTQSLTNVKYELERQLTNIEETKVEQQVTLNEKIDNVADTQPIPLYRIEHMVTTGWEIVDDQLINNRHLYTNLTKDLCNERLNALISEGYNPERLRIRREA